MNWNLGEAARALNMTERELLRLVREGSLPACRIDDQYLFNPVELQVWGTEHDRRLAPEVLPPNGEPAQRLSLAGAVERGGFHYGIAGSTRSQVIDAVARLPEIPALVDRKLLADVLRSRERLASTGVGGGIAIPHPREPLVLQVESPIILLCFLEQAVDFKAIDGQPVKVLFVLLSPTISLHLRLLAWLAHALHDDMLCQLLKQQQDSSAILSRIREIESQISGPGLEAHSQ